MERRRALVVRGGWDGHRPNEATELFIPFLRKQSFDVDISDTPEIYADRKKMAGADLILQSYTMGTISPEALAGLTAAVSAGTGLAGWHGGIADSFRDSADYLHLIGGQFATHPAKLHQDQTEGSPENNWLKYRINIDPAARNHPIVKGLADFDLETEQYWVLTDPYSDVLATTTHKARNGDPWHRDVTVPAVWTRHWGAGRIFVSTPGHTPEILKNPTVRTIVERGILWAAR